MLQNIIASIKNKYTQINQEKEMLRNIFPYTNVFINMFPIIEQSKEISEYNIEIITKTSPDINKEKAKIIDELLPDDELYLNVCYSKEIKTNREFFIVLTNKYIWIINEKEYGAYQYNTVIINIIKNSIMSKTILFNNILLEINGTDTTIKKAIDIITNEKIRQEEITKKLQEYSGIIPIYSLRNKYGAGISIDNNNNIVFHDKINNYLYNINDIKYCEILLDNAVYYSNNEDANDKMHTFQTTCYSMSLRITTNDIQIIIPILNTNTNNTTYSINDSIFIKNLEFAKKVINKIESISTPY